MKMVERVAFRLFVRRGLTHAFGSAEESWERSKDTIVGRECMDEARAVISEMRKPTTWMIRAAYANMDRNGYDKGNPESDYQAMIDMALKEAGE